MSHALVSALLMLLIGGVALAQLAAGPPGEAEFAAAVDEARLRRSVRELVAFGPRMGGTPSNERAAAHLADYFRSLGLDVAVVDDPPTLAHWEDAWQVAFEDGARLESAWPFGFSPSLAVTGDLLLVPDLRQARPSADWKGRVIYTPGDVLRAYGAVTTSGHQPAAILTSAPNDPARYVDWSRLATLPARHDNPVAAFSVSYVDGRALEAAARARRRVSVSLTSHVREASPKTVIATLEGKERDRYFLVCAHGDSDAGGPGADDNASGVATVMEIARVYAALVRGGRVSAPRYSIRFAIWGAEYHSSQAYVAREGARLAGAQAVINFDQTGTGAEREAIYFESNDVPWNQRLLRTLEQVGADYIGQPGFWSEYTTNPSQGGTDSYAFLPRQYRGRGVTNLQIPATTVYTAAWDRLGLMPQTPGWESAGTPDATSLRIDYSLYYHSSGDTPENTTEREPQNMVRAVKAVGLALLRLNR
jgi:hypothetical protein